MNSTILVVDDEATNRSLLATLLAYDGHTVVEAGDGVEALDAVRASRPALVISDILMPRMDGYEFVRQLRRDPLVGHTRVMFYTANYFEPEVRGLATTCGVAHVLTKPCEPDVLLASVRDALHGTLAESIAPALNPADFDREHRRVMTDKLSAKVRELEATQQRLHALVNVGQQLNELRDLPTLIETFRHAGRELLAARETLVTLMPGADPTTPPAIVRSASELQVPVLWGARMHGVISFLGRVGDRPFSDDDERIAVSLAAMLAVAYENALRLEALSRTNEALETRVAQRTAELTRSNEDLEQFAYVASHDLQEPLRMVSAYAELLGRRYSGRLDGDADEFIGYLVDGARRMQTLIRDLLTYSRLARSTAATPVAMSGVVEEAVKRLGAAASETGASITSGPLPTVVGDRTQLVQLFQNLLGNALKFCRENVPPAVSISAVGCGGEWLVAVRDNGIGIDPQYADRIFTIFQRLHTRADYPGTGIGLAICKRIVTRMGGRIWVESRPGDGSTFFFTLPMTAGRES